MAVTAEQIYEQTLVLRAQMGDEEAFAGLMTLHGPGLFGFTRRMLDSAPDRVADLMQEIWVAIYRGLPGLREVDKFRPWALRIARDRVYQEYRKRKLPVTPLDEAIGEEMPGTEREGLEVSREEVEHCLEAISPEQREALVLRYFEDLSYEEIARVTGATAGTVRSRIHYGKRALRTVIQLKG